MKSKVFISLFLFLVPLIAWGQNKVVSEIEGPYGLILGQNEMSRLRALFPNISFYNNEGNSQQYRLNKEGCKQENANLGGIPVSDASFYFTNGQLTRVSLELCSKHGVCQTLGQAENFYRMSKNSIQSSYGALYSMFTEKYGHASTSGSTLSVWTSKNGNQLILEICTGFVPEFKDAFIWLEVKYLKGNLQHMLY